VNIVSILGINMVLIIDFIEITSVMNEPL